jgi:hypothetical protein
MRAASSDREPLLERRHSQITAPVVPSSLRSSLVPVPKQNSQTAPSDRCELISVSLDSTVLSRLSAILVILFLIIG